MTSKHKRLTAIFGIVVMLGSTMPAAAEDPDVCDNKALRRAIRTINDACNSISCDFNKLRELENIDKSALLTALRNRDLTPVHIFFPKGETDVARAFDWRTTKRAQLDTIRLMDSPDDSVVFVIGRASLTGDRETNIAISRERMKSVMHYIQNVLGVKCHDFKGGWVGKEYLQMTSSDAGFLYINDGDYRKDELVLNQAVHVFVFSCKDKL